jgi:DNA mismatch endonuclease (patch repair protein)
MPKTRATFWAEKFERNVDRDRQAIDALEKSGWRVLVVWECETKRPAVLAEKIVGFFFTEVGEDGPEGGSRKARLKHPA